jgi:glycosyltransferase involved in cell wall biosynthesis
MFHFHPLSASLGRTVVDRFAVPPGRVHTSGHSVDTNFFRPGEIAPSAIVSAGMAHRDYSTLVDAASDLDIPVRIAADSTWFHEAVKVEVATLPAHVELKSRGDYVGLRVLYATAHFVVVPMRDVEHTCGDAVIAKAMAMGRAVIATRTRAPGDHVIESETGFLVPPGDVAGLRARSAQLLAGPALSKRMGAAARLLIEQRFTLDQYCARLKRQSWHQDRSNPSPVAAWAVVAF